MDRRCTAAGDSLLEDAANEVRFMERLNSPGHPNVLKLLDVCEDELNLWVVLEFCTGGELWQVSVCVCMPKLYV